MKGYNHSGSRQEQRAKQMNDWTTPGTASSQGTSQRANQTYETTQAQMTFAQAAQARRTAANAALDEPVVAYDRWGNAHVTTKRNQGLAALFTLVFMIVAFIWIFHGGWMSQDCTTTMTSTGPIENQTTRDVTTCK